MRRPRSSRSASIIVVERAGADRLLERGRYSGTRAHSSAISAETSMWNWMP